MKCYNHNNEEAVGICRYCCKAVCKECILQNEYGIIACSPKCLEEIRAEQKMMDKSKMAYGLKPGRIGVSVIFPVALGIVFVLVGLFMSIGDNFIVGLLPMVVGVIFLGSGGLYYYNQKKSGLKV